MKKLIIILSACITLFAGCSASINDIAVTNFNIISVTPRGTNELYATIELGIRNPVIAFTLQDMEGTLKVDGQPCIRITADQLMVDGQSDRVYVIPVKGKLIDGFNPWQLLSVLKDNDFSKFTVDVSARVSLKSGIGKDIAIKDVSLEKLLKKE